MKITNIWREKERKNRYAEFDRGRKIRYIYIKDYLQSEKNSRERKKGINVGKIIIGLKIKIKKKKKNSTELQKLNEEAESFNNKKYD